MEPEPTEYDLAAGGEPAGSAPGPISSAPASLDRGARGARILLFAIPACASSWYFSNLFLYSSSMFFSNPFSLQVLQMAVFTGGNIPSTCVQIDVTEAIAEASAMSESAGTRVRAAVTAENVATGREQVLRLSPSGKHGCGFTAFGNALLTYMQRLST